MASKIKVIEIYRPRIELGHTVQKPELMRAVSRATGLVEGTTDQTIKEFRDQIIEYCRAGRSVKVEGLGTWTPNIGMDGTLDIQYRADTALTNGLNVPGTFTGRILNRENIGKSTEELYDQWNENFPNDQVNLN
ncbi:MAG TPA: hypothetical protein VJ785_17750 [Anaerolineales bacterium]|nr:hypothetical protein [Anaerolineales bacterium]